ncbi:family 43 glycosylhydrolase [Motilibacter sp. E257]|uniref:Family 43 glycosylhydrolase n=1 Tax=Motilibacter deserti TaxID=2714956 RepID=A0ABX0GSY9_9ACTN|nr:family 43 glycosylhydrolase [Motilibacter deserti]
MRAALTSARPGKISAAAKEALFPLLEAAYPAWEPRGSYTTTDNGDGTYSVPLLRSDVPDISVERLPAAENAEGRDVYYMVSTTMHLAPGAPIMKSYDLVNWETVNYVFDRTGVGDPSSLRNGQNSYGAGQWASSLRYHGGRWYVVFNTNNLGGALLFSTDDIENGAWTRIQLGRGLHDPSLFFDDADGGTPYIFYGAGTTSAVRLDAGLTRVVAEYPNIFSKANFPTQAYVTTSYEGQQVFRIGDFYYIASITWPSGGNRQVVLFRSKELLGRYTAVGGVNTWEARSALNSDGFAQGSLVPIARAGGGTDWYGMFFRDTWPLGRIPALIPATWQDGWPTFGRDGVVRLADAFAKPIRLSPEQELFERQKSIVASDDFANDAPHKAYMDTQWTLPPRPVVDQSKLGVELLENGGFESGQLAPWQLQYTADLTVARGDAASGDHSLRVANRVNNGSGPGQVVTGDVQQGVTYRASARVRYDEGPATMRFILAFNDNAGIRTIANVTASRGQWTTVTGTYAVAATADVRNVRFVVETPWAPNQTPADQVSYVIDDLSLVGQPVTVEFPDPAEVAPNGSRLDMAWEWNHAPDNRYWSLTERDGWLRLTTGRAVTGAFQYTKLSGRDELTWFEEARNTLSQRVFGPKASAETKLDISGMGNGDVAGLAAYTRSFSYAAVKRVDGRNTVGVVTRLQPFTAGIDQAAVERFVPGTTVDLGDATEVHLKADADYASSNGQLWMRFYYSLDGRTWAPLGGRQGPLQMDWSLSHFMGYRFGLFNYATQQAGGHVDFDHYLLSDRLTVDGAPDASALDAAIAYALRLDAEDYPAQAWEAMQKALTRAREAAARPAGTQNQLDAPERALSLELARLLVLEEADVSGREASAGRPQHQGVLR